ncbi:hypothetical protein ACNQGB_21165 [Flavobacterium sp. XS1P32]|uniref:hypothetical protein n=1 Tax=unclassified Flavobacterium TaxID=196869 RepID=UPI003AB0348C
MKYAEFNIDSNKIEFLNSIFGIESVLLNGKRISSNFSFSGSIHPIKLKDRDLILKIKYTQFGPKDIKMELMENDILLQEQSVKIDIKQRILTVIIGVTIGFLLSRLLSNI